MSQSLLECNLFPDHHIKGTYLLSKAWSALSAVSQAWSCNVWCCLVRSYVNTGASLQQGQEPRCSLTVQNHCMVILNTSSVGAPSTCWRPLLCWEPLPSEQQLQHCALTALTHSMSPLLSWVLLALSLFPFAPPSSWSYDLRETSASSILMTSAVFLLKCNMRWSKLMLAVALLA